MPRLLPTPGLSKGENLGFIWREVERFFSVLKTRSDKCNNIIVWKIEKKYFNRSYYGTSILNHIPSTLKILLCGDYWNMLQNKLTVIAPTIA